MLFSLGTVKEITIQQIGYKSDCKRYTFFVRNGDVNFAETMPFFAQYCLYNTILVYILLYEMQRPV
jgi:hypothetical protein